MGKAWNSVEDEIVKEYYPKEGSRCAYRMEDRTEVAVVTRAKKLGVTSERAGKKWSEEEDDIIREFYLKEGGKTILRLPGRTEQIRVLFSYKGNGVESRRR